MKCKCGGIHRCSGDRVIDVAINSKFRFKCDRQKEGEIGGSCRKFEEIRRQMDSARQLPATASIVMSNSAAPHPLSYQIYHLKINSIELINEIISKVLNHYDCAAPLRRLK